MAKNLNYILGHSKEELDRLTRQADFYRVLTGNLLVNAGITKGMRVIDFGSGSGDVSIMLSEMVGDTGEVIAVERAEDALDRAKKRVDSLGIKNIRFIEGDENDLSGKLKDKKVDAVFGRLILIHQSDAVNAFCKICENLKPGGIVVFQEADIVAGFWAEPFLPLMSQIYDWLIRAFLAHGIHGNISSVIVNAFDKVGIVDRHIVREGIVQSGPDANGYDYYADAARASLPVMIKYEIATAEQVDVDTLAERLRAEAVEHNASFIPLYLTGAYGRMPG